MCVIEARIGFDAPLWRRRFSESNGAPDGTTRQRQCLRIRYGFDYAYWLKELS
jgi:hypothetical protein